MTEKHVCPPEHKHADTLTCVTAHSCKCGDCMTLWAEYCYWSRHMRDAGRDDVFDTLVDARGARRRLQALAAIGWSQARVGRELGTTQAQVWAIQNRERIRRSTHNRVAEIYDRLSNLTPPAETRRERQSATRARNTAIANGWARPIDWDDIDVDEAPQTGIPIDVDEVAVELAVDGYRVTLTRAERHIAVTTLNRDRGYDDQVIARMLGVSDKTIGRDREYLNLPAAVGPDGERIAA